MMLLCCWLCCFIYKKTFEIHYCKNFVYNKSETKQGNRFYWKVLFWSSAFSFYLLLFFRKNEINFMISKWIVTWAINSFNSRSNIWLFGQTQKTAKTFNVGLLRQNYIPLSWYSKWWFVLFLWLWSNFSICLPYDLTTVHQLLKHVARHPFKYSNNPKTHILMVF